MITGRRADGGNYVGWLTINFKMMLVGWGRWSLLQFPDIWKVNSIPSNEFCSSNFLIFKGKKGEII